jgi:ribosomal protein S18 acetylase RimI-like enzyme
MSAGLAGGQAGTWLRERLRPGDVEAIRALVQRTRVFSAAEVEVAAEVAAAGLAGGDASGYRFLLVAGAAGLAGFSAYGPIPATAASFDLYWIAVDPARQRHGLGSRLLAETEARAAALGCRRLYVDTSGRADYAPARAFYERHGYRRAATLEDFYAPGDPKLIYCKAFPPTAARRRAEGQKA